VPEFVYTMKKARKAVGDKVILDDVTMSFYPGAKIGVVGPNGAGKSTILKIMAGLDTPSNGEAFLTPGFSVGILMQEPKLDESKTVLENIQEAFGDINAKLARYNQVLVEMETDYTEELLEEMGTLQEELDHAGAWDLEAKIDQAMDALRCPPGDSAVDILSGGERRRVALCQLLLSAPDLLLLDEPTNHLDAESVQWLEQFLASYPGAVLAVTHDRYFLDNVAQWIAEVDRGRLIPYEGNYSTYLEKKSDRMTVEGRKDVKLAKRLKEELAWVRSGAKARQAKSKSRLARYEEMAAEAERTRKLDFEEIQIPPGPRLGSIVVEVHDLKKGFDDRQPVVHPAAQRDRGGHRAQRRRQDHPVQDHRRAGGTGRRQRQDRRDGQAFLRRPEPRRPRPEEERLAGGLRRTGLHQGRARRDAVTGVRLGVRVQGP
jgi:ATPase subunit of ABC transporter with duplicated ATPase domains